MNILQNKPLVIGHRGAAGEAPENTLASFALAVKQGADAVELDVHLSADGELIVCHDATVNRTTDGAGAIADLTAAQLRRLDAGRWFDEKYAGEPVPTLEEVFRETPAGVMINVEIKCPYSSRLQMRLFELLKLYGRLEGTVVSSFNHKILHSLQAAEPVLKVGLLYDANLVHHRRLAESSGMNVYSLHPYHLLIDPEDVADATANGLQVYPFTVNDEGQMHRAVMAGMSGIITDYPARLRSLLERMT
ncbi:glycerophosphodiester phosphodiesterase [Paenibacillus sp. S-38]|uniref:glycerophosphodiester phosphodiesterase n=1 Tax=Paenibacillus sp. S-38 TaxID=3416710 RepID=UPI003CF6EFFC